MAPPGTSGWGAPAPNGGPTPASPKGPWGRFRGLPTAVQVICWLGAAILAIAAIGVAVGGSNARSTLNPDGATPVPNTPSLTTTSPSTAGSPISASPAAPSSAPTTNGASASGRCRSGNPLADVYHPYRLKVQNACMTVTGTVAYIRNEDDGDVHFNLSLPAGESHLLDRANYSYEHGELVVEIVPADQPGCTPGQPPPLPSTAYTSSSYNYGVCTGADISTPPLGAQVSVTGPYDLDSGHGWMEIHPVWSITVLSVSSSPVASQSPPPAADTEPPPAAAAPSGSASSWCQASAAPSNDGYSGDYQVYVNSNQPNTKATASDAGDTWSGFTNGSGYANIRLYHTSPGMAITVTVGAASCSTTA